MLLASCWIREGLAGVFWQQGDSVTLLHEDVACNSVPQRRLKRSLERFDAPNVFSILLNRSIAAKLSCSCSAQDTHLRPLWLVNKRFVHSSLHGNNIRRGAMSDKIDTLSEM
jgi:hypothetical protein